MANDIQTSTEETVTISLKLYNQLAKGASWLAALEAAGVDNWEGISHAQDLWGDEDDIY